MILGGNSFAQLGMLGTPEVRIVLGFIMFGGFRGSFHCLPVRLSMFLIRGLWVYVRQETLTLLTRSTRDSLVM